MICLECGEAELRVQRIQLTGIRHGETYTITLEDGLQCPKCGFATIDDDQSAEFTRLLSDEYRRAHGLLTGEEIRARRRQLNMSQYDFADHLGVGVASVKRWESGKVQEKAMDELIRLKTDPQAARQNLKDLEAHVPERHILSAGVMGGWKIELSLSSREQRYEKTPRMNLDRSALLGEACDDELCWAAA